MRKFFTLCVFLIIALGAVITAARIEKDFGALEIERVSIPSQYGGEIIGKLYRLKNDDSPGPGLLAMHGYQNDKESNNAYVLEMARRGYAVLSIDLFGHGDTTVPLRFRGWDNSKGVFQRRYNLLTGFSHIRGDVEGLIDPTLGGAEAYEYFRKLPYVDANRIAITGHSLGTWSAWSLAQIYPDHRALVLQCGDPRGPVSRYNNVLLLQAKYDEYDLFRDDELTVKDLNQKETRYNLFAGQSQPIEWNRQYGQFDNGTARQMNLYHIIHRLMTHNSDAVAHTITWLDEAVDYDSTAYYEPHEQNFRLREYLQLLAMLCLVISVLPLMNLLLELRFFQNLKKEMPAVKVASGKRWRKDARIAIIISAISYPIIAQLGHGLFPLPESLTRTLVANGIGTWFGFLIIVTFFMMRKRYGKKLPLHDLGLSTSKNDLFKTLLLGALIFLWLYALVWGIFTIWGIEIRFIWPFFRVFSGVRFWQFLLYIPIYFLFFLLNGGAKLFGQMRQPESASPWKTQLIWWLKNVYIMLGGLLVIVLVEYIPFLLGIGPGIDAMGLGLFGGTYMSALIIIVPQFVVLFFITTYCFRKTGRVYLGSLLTALFAVWIVTGGSAYF